MCAGYNNTLYSLSMTMNFRRRYITDFGRIEGIPGVYMANQLSSKMLTDPSAMRSLDFEKFIQTKVRFALWPHAMSCIPALPALAGWLQVSQGCQPCPMLDATTQLTHPWGVRTDISLYAACAQITFNGGGSWQDLAKPQHYRHGVCNQCPSNGDSSACKLHLHGPSSWHDGPGKSQNLS